MEITFLVGLIILGLYWLSNAYGHTKNHAGMANYAASKSILMPKVAVVGTGVLLLIGGLSMVTGYYPAVGIVVLVIFLLGVTFTMHTFWKETEPMMKMNQQIQFNKNLALLGALLMMVAISQPWMWSL